MECFNLEWECQLNLIGNDRTGIYKPWLVSINLFIVKLVYIKKEQDDVKKLSRNRSTVCSAPYAQLSNFKHQMWSLIIALFSLFAATLPRLCPIKTIRQNARHAAPDWITPPPPLLSLSSGLPCLATSRAACAHGRGGLKLRCGARPPDVPYEPTVFGLWCT